MSLIPNLSGPYYNYTFDNNTSMNTQDHALAGKMLTATFQVDVLLEGEPDEKSIKKKLSADLANSIIEGKFAEFTKQMSPDYSMATYRARVYLLPDDQVKVVRTIK